MRLQSLLGRLLVIFAGFSSLAVGAPPSTVHIVFKTHLDLGFTDFADRVVETYCDDYFPRALAVSKELRTSGGSERLVWTSGSWLIDEYLRRATPEQRLQLEEGIKAGDLVWHAYPLTTVTELMDESLYRFGLGIARDLDRRYGRETITAKLTDVPGETRAVVPVLHELGIRFLHIGVNPASTIPKLPPLFRWSDSNGAEVLVALQPNYGSIVEMPGCPHILYFAFTGDNKGPPSAAAVRKTFSEARAKYPGAVVLASTMDAWARAVWPMRESLPTVTEEIGSTWVHSAGTDPLRYAAFRALLRLRSNWLQQGRLTAQDSRLQAFSRQLLLVAEHTGGLDEKEHLDFDHYTPDELAQVRTSQGYRDMEQSWVEARAYVDRAVAALGSGTLADEARAAVEATQPSRTEAAGFAPFESSAVLHTAFFDLRMDPRTGALASLQDRETRREWVDPKAPLGLFWHESFSEADYTRFLDQYLTVKQPWALKDFGKPNLGRVGAVSIHRLPRLLESRVRRDETGVSLLLRLKMEEAPPVDYGLPRELWLRIDFPVERKQVRYTVQWYGKRACRLPEAYWFSLGLADLPSSGWSIEKVGRFVSPLAVVSKGGRSLHAFDRGVFHVQGDRRSSIESLDCPVVAPGRPSLLDFNDKIPDLSGGWHFNLYNSKWGTNFPTWYDDDAQFRFVLTL